MHYNSEQAPNISVSVKLQTFFSYFSVNTVTSSEVSLSICLIKVSIHCINKRNILFSEVDHWRYLVAKIGLYSTTKPLNTLTIHLTILLSVRKNYLFRSWRLTLLCGKNRPVIYQKMFKYFDYTFDYTVINKRKILFLEVEDWCYFVAKISLNFTTKPLNTLIIQLTILPSIWDKNFLYIDSLIFTVHPF